LKARAAQFAFFRNPMQRDAAFDASAGNRYRPWRPAPDHLAGLLSISGTGGNLTCDAHLAALALEYRAELCSFDRDFLRFPDLKWLNPLA
jgi:predicted nucleic acid-binding protein